MTSDPKNSSSSIVGSYTSTGTPLSFTRIMMPWIELARKLSLPLFMVRR